MSEHIQYLLAGEEDRREQLWNDKEQAVKELQKYYAWREFVHTSEHDGAEPVYKCSEADAHIAALKQKIDGLEVYSEGLLQENRRFLENASELQEECTAATQDASLQRAGIEALNQQHAEEIERLRAQLQAMHRRAQIAEQRDKELSDKSAQLQGQLNFARQYKDANLDCLRKQAERYEKLRRLSIIEIYSALLVSIKNGVIQYGSIDDLVDALP